MAEPLYEPDDQAGLRKFAYYFAMAAALVGLLTANLVEGISEIIIANINSAALFLTGALAVRNVNHNKEKL